MARAESTNDGPLARVGLIGDVHGEAAALASYATDTHPALVEYVRRSYDDAGTFDGDEEYIVFARRGRPVLRAYGPQGWPCYTTGP